MKKRHPLRGLLVGFLIVLVAFPSAREGAYALMQSLLVPIQYVIGGILALALAGLVFGLGVRRR